MDPRLMRCKRSDGKVFFFFFFFFQTEFQGRFPPLRTVCRWKRNKAHDVGRYRATILGFKGTFMSFQITSSAEGLGMSQRMRRLHECPCVSRQQWKTRQEIENQGSDGCWPKTLDHTKISTHFWHAVSVLKAGLKEYANSTSKCKIQGFLF